MEVIERDPLPKFEDLERVFGWKNAVREWKKAHHADQLVEVGPWPVEEFIAIHREVAHREGDPRRHYGSNDTWLVTETGGRLHTPHCYNEQLGWPAPRDPPSDDLLRLTWIAKFYQGLIEQHRQRFHEMKSDARRRAEKGQRNPVVFDDLEVLADQILSLQSQLDEFEEERSPLLPPQLRPPTPEVAALNAEVVERESAFDAKLDSIEI